MLGLFRNNQFIIALPLALYIGLTHLAALPRFMQMPVSGAPQGGVLYLAWFGWADGQQFWSAVGAAALVFVQALLVNNLADAFRLMSDRNWLPGLFYALVVVCLPDFLLLSPPLVAVTFVPLVLWRIFKAYQQPKAMALIFDAALWTTVASLFYPPAIFLLVAVYAGIGVMRSFDFRERMVMLTGMLVALFLAWLWYFWTDRGGGFWQVQFGGLFGLYRFDFSLNEKILLQMALSGVLLLTVLLSYGTYMFRNLIQTQKRISVLYWFLFVSGLTVFLQYDPRPAHFMLLAPSVGIFLGLSFSAWRNRFWTEVFHLLLLGAVFFIQYYSFIL